MGVGTHHQYIYCIYILYVFLTHFSLTLGRSTGTYARGFFQPELSWTHQGLAAEDDQRTSDCFLMTMPLDRTAHEEHFEILVQEPTRMGMFLDEEACGPIHYIDDHERVFLAGKTSADHYGERDAFGTIIPKDIITMGQVLSTSVEPLAYGAPPILPQHYMFGGRGQFDSYINHPVALTSDFYHNISGDFAPEDQFLYLASFSSRYSGGAIPPARENITEFDQTFPNALENAWSITVQRLRVQYTNATNPNHIRNQDLHVKRDYISQIKIENNLGLQPADIVYWQNRLFLLGSTQSNDPKFGTRSYEDRDDWDGFIVELSPSTGEITPTSRAIRVQTDFGDDEFVRGSCQYGRNLFIVGQTTGQVERAYVDGGAIIYKVNLETFEVEWKKILVGPGLEAYDCETSLTGEYLYITGNARNGGVVEEAFSRGGDDVWVGKFRSSTGEQEWIRQIGSDKNETVARSGAIVVDKYDNAIIYGNTFGSIGRVRVDYVDDETNDIFVLTVTAEGEYSPPLPIEFFQIPKTYFIESGGMDWAFSFYMLMIAIVLLLVLLLIYASWKPWDELFESSDSTTEDDFDEFKSLKHSDPNDVTASHNSFTSRSGEGNSLTSRSGNGNDSTIHDTTDGSDEDIEGQRSPRTPAPTAQNFRDFLSDDNVGGRSPEPIDITYGYNDDTPHFSDRSSEEEKQEEESPFKTNLGRTVAVSAGVKAAANVASRGFSSRPPDVPVIENTSPKAKDNVSTQLFPSEPKPEDSQTDFGMFGLTAASAAAGAGLAATSAPKQQSTRHFTADDDIESLEDMLDADDEILLALNEMDTDSNTEINETWDSEALQLGALDEPEVQLDANEITADSGSWDGSAELDIDEMNAQLDAMNAEVDDFSLDDDFKLPPR